jgi:uncharacterized membrane protein YgcG
MGVDENRRSPPPTHTPHPTPPIQTENEKRQVNAETKKKKELTGPSCISALGKAVVVVHDPFDGVISAAELASFSRPPYLELDIPIAAASRMRLTGSGVSGIGVPKMSESSSSSLYDDGGGREGGGGADTVEKAPLEVVVGGTGQKQKHIRWRRRP